jgi:hypothetical protein
MAAQGGRTGLETANAGASLRDLPFAQCIGGKKVQH